MKRSVHIVAVAVAEIIGLLLWAASTGCATDPVAGPKPTRALGPTTSLGNPGGVNVPPMQVADRTETDLVEEVLLHRAQYARGLEVLSRYYSEHGYENKANWARSELNDLRRYVKPYQYILDSEVPQTQLKPSASIAEADRLYKEGRNLMIRGGHHVPIWYNDSTMKQALAKFKELVEKYPNSDKVADAAYYIGEIYKEYGQEKDNQIAIEWYKRALDWDPNIQHPARFRIATTLDYRMHEREEALHWYQEVLQKEQFDNSNLLFTRGRIRELTTAKTRHAPGEAVPSEGAPEPAGMPEPPSEIRPSGGQAVEASPPPRTP